MTALMISDDFDYAGYNINTALLTAMLSLVILKRVLESMIQSQNQYQRTYPDETQVILSANRLS